MACQVVGQPSNSEINSEGPKPALDLVAANGETSKLISGNIGSDWF